MAVATPMEAVQEAREPRLFSRGVQLRLFLTCWLVYLLHFSPYVVRELYLAMSLAEKHSVLLDDYVDLHPDLFVVPGRGAFLGGNPGAAFLAAVPYWLALPVVNRVAPVRPPKPGEEVSAEYNEQRTNRLLFYRKVRQRGLDVRLGLAGAITTGLFMAPLAAFSAVVMLRLLGRFGFSRKASLWLALLYALGTPIFFRAATLSQNLLVALVGVFGLALLVPSAKAPAQGRPWRLFLAGLLAGWAVLSDYSGLVTAGALGLFALAQDWKSEGASPALKRSLWFLAGALVPIALLLFYQWYCFGSPWLPAQYYMPRQIFRGYQSEYGFGWPLPAALWGLLFDPLYGLLVFAPVLALAVYHPVLLWRRQNRVPALVALVAWVFFLGLLVFCSSIHYTLRHQWQNGVRYMVPAVPFLFLLVADVLARLPRAMAGLVAFAAVAQTWCLSMVREDPLESIARVFSNGPELPWLTTLVKAAPQYMPSLAAGISPLPLLVFCGVVIWGLWRLRLPRRARV